MCVWRKGERERERERERRKGAGERRRRQRRRRRRPRTRAAFLEKKLTLFHVLLFSTTPQSPNPNAQDSIPRGVIDVHRCLSIKGAEDAINRPHAFELSTADEAMFFIADSDKEKEDWINAVGRAIVRHSRSLLEGDQADYTPASLGGGGGGGGGGP